MTTLVEAMAKKLKEKLDMTELGEKIAESFVKNIDIDKFADSIVSKISEGFGAHIVDAFADEIYSDLMTEIESELGLTEDALEVTEK